MDAKAVNNVHPNWKILYKHGGKVQRRLWGQYNSPKWQKCEMRGRRILWDSTYSRGIEEVT
jgi:hypothetical protein